MQQGFSVASKVFLASSLAIAADPQSASLLQPLALQEARESVYAPPTPPRDSDGTNMGAVHTELAVSYLTDYMFRGIERFEYDPSFPRNPDAPPPPTNTGKEDAANLQFDGKISFDLGKFPSPFIGLFVNVAEDVNEGQSNFQEIRPTVGFDWNLRPVAFSFGLTSFIFPEDQYDANGVPESSEVFGLIQLDDSYFFRTEKPILSPYLFVSYDYSEFHGTYFEAGASHRFEIEDTGLSFVLEGSVAYASGLSELYAGNSGFQHYQFGLIGEYSLNQLFNFSSRYGEWAFRGYIYYTGEIDDTMRVSEQTWGGAGIGFKY